MRHLLVICGVAFALSARGQGVAPTPAGFSFAVSDATSPAPFQFRLSNADGPTQRKVATAPATRAAIMTLNTVEATDADVLTATLRFAALDPRYPQIDSMSYYGVKLSQIKKQIKAEGLTAANKTTLLQLYGDATAALKAFLAAEASNASQ